MTERKIKSIEYFSFDGKIEPNKAASIFKAKLGLHKVENFDINGNIVKEYNFNRNMISTNIVERKFDSKNNLIELLTFRNQYDQSLTKTYLSKYIYQNSLLSEELYYYAKFDSSGFWSRNKITYNNNKQKIKVEYNSYNDDAEKEIRTFEWKDQYSYIEDRTDKEGILAERHFVRLDKNGNELEHRINFGPTSKDDYTFPIYFIKVFDGYGNEIKCNKKFEGSLEETTVSKYLYEGKIWNYKLQNTDENYFTEFRRILYY